MADLAPSLRKSLLTVLTSDAYNPMLPIVRAEERPRFNVCSEQYAEVLRQCSVQAGDVEVGYPPPFVPAVFDRRWRLLTWCVAGDGTDQHGGMGVKNAGVGSKGAAVREWR